MGRVERDDVYAVITVPSDLSAPSLSDDELLSAMTAYEQAAAALAGLSSVMAGALARRRRGAVLQELGPDAARTTIQRELAGAEAAVVDEIRLATGLGTADAVGRVRIGSWSRTRTARVRAALTSGQCTWAMARSWAEETRELPAQVADEVAETVFRATRDGAALSYGTFISRLSREMARHVEAKKRRDADLGRRDACATLTPHGTGEITVSGSAERIRAAIERLDGLARLVRGRGDARTLAQLRSDITLDLLIFGDIPGLATPVPAGMVPGERPQDVAAPSRSSGAATPSRTPGASSPSRSWDAAAPTRTTGGASFSSTRNTAQPAQQADLADRVRPARSNASAPPDTPVDVVPRPPEWVCYFPGGLPPALIRVTLSAAALLELSNEPGRLADGTALSAEVLRDLAYSLGSTWRRLVTDPVTGEAIELSSTSYAPPPRLREALQVRDGTCRAPGSLVPAERCDVDHDIPWPTGPTCATNLSAKSRRPHGHKTRGQWATTQTPDGAIVWATGTGRCYTTYPMQYDETAPGRGSTGGTCTATGSGTTPSDAATAATNVAASLDDHPPIEYRPRGVTPATRPGPRPDPGPPPF